MMKSNGLIASALLFQVILASEFEDSIYDLISNSLDGVSPEFVPVSEGPNMRMVSKTPKYDPRIIKNSINRIYFPPKETVKSVSKSQRNIKRFIQDSRIKFRESSPVPYKPGVESIKVYECGNFFMRCEFRPNFDVEYPLHCKMASDSIYNVLPKAATEP